MVLFYSTRKMTNKILETRNKISKYFINHNLFLKYHPNIKISKHIENTNLYRLKKQNLIKKKEAL